MGKAAGGAETRKKKKGRPSLLDVQKRLLKQQKLQQSPSETPISQSHSDTHSNPSRRSNRRYPNSDWSHQASELISGDEDDDDERIQKKRRPLLGLDSQSPNLLANDNYEGEKVSRVTDTGDLEGSQNVSGPTTPLPDKKLLAFILDRLQKKDTHGVFSEPVDPEELPDYHDIVKHPMDFGTVRKKLDEGAYTNLEQFEKDIFLICSNAMQYNAPDTIFFKQARSMQEIATKDFESLRQESDDSELEQPKETPKVARRGRPPGSGKGSKKLSEVDKAAAYCIRTEVSSDTAGNNSFLSSTYNLRRAPDPSIFQSADPPVNPIRGTPNRENQNSWFAEFDKEFPASVLRRVMKEGKKLFTSEDNRRESYRQNLLGQEATVFPPEISAKQLELVDFHPEHAYARSLAQFAADLGPVAQRIASKKIGNALQCGMDLSLRLISENRTSDCNQQLQTPKNAVTTPNNNSGNSAQIASVARSHHAGSSVFSLQPEEDLELVRRLTSESKLRSSSTNLGDVPFLQLQQKLIGGTCYGDGSGPPEVLASSSYTPTHQMSVHSIDFEGQNFCDSSHEFQQLSTSLKCDANPEERCLDWRVGAVVQKPQRGSVSCEPNARFLVGGSSQQPDLGLQL